MCEIFPFCDPLCSMALNNGDNSFTSTVLVPRTHLDNDSSPLTKNFGNIVIGDGDQIIDSFLLLTVKVLRLGLCSLCIC